MEEDRGERLAAALEDLKKMSRKDKIDFISEVERIFPSLLSQGSQSSRCKAESTRKG